MNIENFINTTVLTDLKKMVESPRLQYLSFGIMGSIIEFFGACLDNDEFLKGGLSKRRFRQAINNLDSFNRYRTFNINGSYHDLYVNLRCGMVHVGIPGKGIAFTERGNPTEKDMHLEIHGVEDSTHPSRLILVCEDLYEDIRNSAHKVMDLMNNNKITKRLTDSYLNPNLRVLSSP